MFSTNINNVAFLNLLIEKENRKDCKHLRNHEKICCCFTIKPN